MKKLIYKVKVKSGCGYDGHPHYWLVLLGRNGQIIFQTETYKNKPHAKNIAERTAAQLGFIPVLGTNRSKVV